MWRPSARPWASTTLLPHPATITTLARTWRRLTASLHTISPTAVAAMMSPYALTTLPPQTLDHCPGAMRGVGRATGHNGHARHFAVHWCGDLPKCRPNREAASCLAAYLRTRRKRQGIGKNEHWDYHLTTKQQCMKFSRGCGGIIFFIVIFLLWLAV